MILTPSPKIIAFIKRWEGFRPKAYRKLVGDPWVIGYGFRAIYGCAVQREDSLTEQEADQILRTILCKEYPKYFTPAHYAITQNQYDAMVSLAYDIGIFSLINSKILRRFRDGHDISGMFMAYAKDGANDLGRLARRVRREEERLIYCSGEYPEAKDTLVKVS